MLQLQALQATILGTNGQCVRERTLSHRHTVGPGLDSRSSGSRIHSLTNCHGDGEVTVLLNVMSKQGEVRFSSIAEVGVLRGLLAGPETARVA